LDSFQEKMATRKERKRRAKMRKADEKKESDVGKRDADGAVKTDATRAKSLSSLPAVVVYSDPRKRRIRRLKEEEAKEEEDAKKQLKQSSSLPMNFEVSMKSARYDVFKLGMRGMDKRQREDAEVERLVGLGAKRPKNKGVSYMEFKETRKKERDEMKAQKEEEKVSGVRIALLRKSFSSAASSSASKKSKDGGIGGIQTKIGSFDGGMLKLSAKDLAKIKGGKKNRTSKR
jgi:hypothetical protein